MSIKTIEDKLEQVLGNIDAIHSKLNNIIDKLTNRRYEDEIQAQAARIRFLQAELFNATHSREALMENIRRAVVTYFDEPREE